MFWEIIGSIKKKKKNTDTIQIINWLLWVYKINLWYSMEQKKVQLKPVIYSSILFKVQCVKISKISLENKQLNKHFTWYLMWNLGVNDSY